MRWNILEISNNGCYLRLFRGFILVIRDQKELGRVIIDELNCVLISAIQSALSKPVMVKLAENGVPIILCGNNYHPISITLPYTNHHQSYKILQNQINISQPLKKRLWQSLVKTKINHQRQVLTHCQPNQQTAIKLLKRLSDKVRSGDSDNCEAQAARIYWRALFGSTFRRNQQSNDYINSALNYGYTVIRAACARAAMGAGLNPALGLHHHNQYNPFCLADDLMELFRPLVDLTVTESKLDEKLNPKHKAMLAKLLQADMKLNQEQTTLTNATHKLASSLAQSIDIKVNNLQIPKIIIK